VWRERLLDVLGGELSIGKIKIERASGPWISMASAEWGDLGWWITSPEMDCYVVIKQSDIYSRSGRENYELILMLKNEVDRPG
jgi:hypothetical protein